jgi:MOSC domain-containing protein YiiM
MSTPIRVLATAGKGLVGDRYAGSAGKREVTLVQAEHLPLIAAWLAKSSIDAIHLRRNIVVSGINLLSLKGARFQIGGAVLEGTGPCDPCSKMEQRLGPGGFAAMRGHGGITAKVVKTGEIALGDMVMPQVDDDLFAIEGRL